MQFQPAVEAFSPGATATGTGAESARHRAAADRSAWGDDAKDDVHSDSRGRGTPWQRRVPGTEAPTRHVHGERASSASRSTGAVGIVGTVGERSDFQDEPGESGGSIRWTAVYREVGAVPAREDPAETTPSEGTTDQTKIASKKIKLLPIIILFISYMTVEHQGAVC